MLASPGPAAAVAALAGLWERCSETSGFLLPRAGAHHGPAISRDGDYLGATVNLAARVAGHAGGGQILVTSGVARAASDTGFEVARLGPHRVHNVTAPVELFEIRFDASDPPGTIDPVCRMRVEPHLAAGSLCHEGQRFWFCSMPCAAAFAADPGRYLIPARDERVRGAASPRHRPDARPVTLALGARAKPRRAVRMLRRRQVIGGRREPGAAGLRRRSRPPTTHLGASVM